MQVLVVVCHPDPESLSHSLAAACLDAVSDIGHAVTLIDLYHEHADGQFDPVLSHQEILRRFSFDDTVQRYSRDVASADGYIFVHPDWWGMPPALLKGWLDRVFRPGVVYDYEAPDFLPKQRVKLLAGRRAFVVCTTDAKAEEFADDRASHQSEASNPMEVSHPISSVWRRSIFGFCGIEDAQVRVLWNVRESTLRARRRWIADVRSETARIFGGHPKSEEETKG